MAATPPNLTLTWKEVDPNYPDNKGLFYRLYENGVLLVDKIGQLSFTVLMAGKAYKPYDYYLTAVDEITNTESDPSNHFAVNFHKPAAPTGLTGSWVQ